MCKSIAEAAKQIREQVEATVEPVARITTVDDWKAAALKTGFRETDRTNWLRFENNVWVLLEPDVTGFKRGLSEVHLGLHSGPVLHFDWAHTTPKQLAQICEALERAQTALSTVNDLVDRYAKTKRKGKARIQYVGSR